MTFLRINFFMDNIHLLYILFATLVFSILYLWFNSRSEKALSLPPGPAPLPIIGSLFHIPKEREWITYRDWAQKWGSIMSVTVLNQTLIILDKAEDAFEMLEGKQSSFYSERPSIPMADLIGWNNSLGLTAFKDEKYQAGKKIFHRLMGTNAALNPLHEVIEDEMKRFLKSLAGGKSGMLKKSENELSGQITTWAVSQILRITYGYTIKEKDDPLVKTAHLAMSQFTGAVTPGRFLVNLIPTLKKLPEWMPGAEFKRQARTWANTLSEMVEHPYKLVRQEMVKGTAQPSLVSTLLDDFTDGSRSMDKETEHHIKWVGATIYSGGADTTVVALHAFFMAMILYPDIQRKAQEEITRVIGNDRFPTCVDRAQLPYVNAIVMETLRWHTVTPLGMPHMVSEDNIYKGYHIPRGSMIFPNIWSMTHNPDVYPEPMLFKPERFLAPSMAQPDPRKLVFGFGRRKCVGERLADLSLFMACAGLLASFHISPFVDENGTTVLPIPGQEPGIISHTPSFRCIIEPRSEGARSLIEAYEK